MAHGIMYETEVRHDDLNKYRHIRGQDRRVVEEKARAQLATWDELWRKKQEMDGRKAARQQAAQAKEEKKRLAQERTGEAREALASLENTLAHTLDVDDAIQWNSLKSDEAFPKPKPSFSDKWFQPVLGFFDILFPGTWKRKTGEARARFGAARKNWEAERDEFIAIRKEQHAAVDDLEQRYRDKEPDAIEEYCDMVLSNSNYPDAMPKEYELEYKPESGLVIIEYRIPSMDDLPTLREVKYMQSRDEFDQVHLRKSELNKLYDSLIYQICLRTIHEIFEADVVDAVSSVAFNGWVEFIDRATGNETRACIMSVQTAREPFLAINLANVEPKECFRTLKGVGSSKMHAMAPIAPVVRMSREDARFVQGVDVIDQMEEGTNLAAIDWQEFEHLIREVFEKEFSKSGGEVKVTQASRDGGVDAIAFDPDPIRGGKIVIQAKRYTNVVGVSAVRDLYGTVMNEGASKGILVTTSSYGPDAYEFAKGKPITLLDGGNLLHLLGEHGHKARINLAEARKLASEENG